MLGSLISAGMSLFAGNKTRKAQEKANAQNAALQKEFAQNSIRWRVSDAKKAGLHPLAALGASSTAASPSFRAGDYGYLAQAGQDVGTAINRTLSPRGQTNRYAQKVQELDLQHRSLQNQLLSTQIAKERAAPSPGIPDATDRYLIDGQPSSGLPGLVVTKPLRRQAAAPENKTQEAGAVTDMGFTRTQRGYFPVMSDDAKKRLEDDTLGMLAWNWRNRIMPFFGFNQNPPPHKLPKGFDKWVFDPRNLEYRPMKRGYRGWYYY